MWFRKGWPSWLAPWPGLANQSTPPIGPSWFVQLWLGQVGPIRGLPWHLRTRTVRRNYSFSGPPRYMDETSQACLGHLPHMLEGDVCWLETWEQTTLEPWDPCISTAFWEWLIHPGANTGLIWGLFWVWLPSFTTRKSPDIKCIFN